MNLDVRELRDFYASPLGLMVRRLIGQRLRARWPNVRGETILGMGYAAPFLGVFRGEAGRLAALMPEGQGVVMWPSAGPYQSALVDETRLPLGDCVADRLVVAHSLEVSEHPRPLLRELWRVLKPEGAALIIVPNRASMWSRLESTPFGHGRPFSRGQLERLLAEACFAPEGWGHALHLPPFGNRFILRGGISMERWGARYWPVISGVILVEARKAVFAPIGRRRMVPVQVGAGVPVWQAGTLKWPPARLDPRG